MRQRLVLTAVAAAVLVIGAGCSSSPMATPQPLEFAFVTNKTANSISILRVNADTGELAVAGEASSSPCDGPRYAELLENGKLLLVSCQVSSNLAMFAVDRSTGNLTFTGQFATGSDPYAFAL